MLEKIKSDILTSIKEQKNKCVSFIFIAGFCYFNVY